MQATSRLRIGGTTICSRTVRGFDFGSVMEFAAARDITARTRASAATIGCKRGTGFQSTGAGRLGRLLLCRMCSTRVRRCITICPLCGETSHRAGSGCAEVLTLRGSFSSSSSRSGAKTGLSATGLMALYCDPCPDYSAIVTRFTEALAQHQLYSAATPKSVLNLCDRIRCANENHRRQLVAHRHALARGN